MARTYFASTGTVKHNTHTTGKWNVLTRDNTILGTIAWWTFKRRYLFTPKGKIYDASCLSAIADFITEQTRQHDIQLQQRRAARAA